MATNILKIGDIINDMCIVGYSGVNTKGEPLYRVACMKCGYTANMMTEARIRKNVNCQNHIEFEWSNPQIRATYQRMLARCNNPNWPKYKNYGGKGIKVCKLWTYNPQEFNDWCLDNGFKPGYALVRYDNDKNYSPENCHWVSQKESSNNREYKFITFRNISYKLSDLSTILTGKPDVLKNYRINHGGKEALQRLLDTFAIFAGVIYDNGVRYVRIGNEKLTLSEWDEKLNLTGTKYAMADKEASLNDVEIAKLVCFTLAYGYKNKAGMKAQYFDVHGHMLSTRQVSDIKGYKATKWLLNRIREYGYDNTVEFLNASISKEEVDAYLQSKGGH